MSDEKKRMVTIKRGTMNMTIERKELVSINQTFDGIVFNFSNGSQLSITDSYMPLQTKNLLESICSIPNGSVNINLDNYRSPTSINI